MEQIEIIFIYNQSPVKIQCVENDIFKKVIEKFSQKVKTKSKNLYFLFNGKIIEPDQIVKDIFSNEIKNNSIIQVLVFVNSDINTVVVNNNDNKLSSDIICPKCENVCQIAINDYKFNFLGCKQGHTVNDIIISDYRANQKIDESKIVCHFCQIGNKASIFENKFYICLTCKKYLCPICKSKHENNHDIIDFEEKNYKCFIHGETFCSFCRNCKINLCIECEAMHFDKENLIFFRDILPNKERYKSNLTELKIKIDTLKEKINEIKKTFDKVIINLETYYEINNNLLKNYEKKRKNYQLLYNIKILEEYNNSVINDINIGIKKYDFFEIIDNCVNFLNKFGIKFNGKNIEQIVNKKEKEEPIGNKEEKKEKEIIIKKQSFPNEIKDNEKLMCVCFTMEGENEIHCPLICKNKQIFNELEETLYDKYPDCRQTENYFICNGNMINKDKTMEENNIQNGSIIVMGITD